jgi:hypothetical protein
MIAQELTIADLRAEIVSAAARAAFDTLLEGFSAFGDCTLIPHHKGFINSLRVLRGDDFCFSNIPNDEWVLAYIRRPELRRGRLTTEIVMAEFPEAHLNRKGEVTLRVRDAATASRWVEMIKAAG